MGLRFQRHVSLGGGISLNLGKRSASVSAGGRGGRITIGSRGAHASASLPGTGISYRTGGGGRGRAKPQGGSALVGYLFLFLIGWLVLHLAGIA